MRLAQGDFDARTVYERRPARGRARVGRGGRARRCTSSTSTARAPARRANLRHLERIARELDVPVQYGGGLRSLPAVRDALRAGRGARDPRHRRVHRHRLPRRRRSARYGERVVVSVDARGGHVSTAGWTETTQMPADGRHRRACSDARRASSSSTPTSTATGCSRAPTSTRCGAIAERRARALPVLGRDRHARRTWRRSPRLRQVNLAGVIVGKALYEGRFTVAEAQAALA